MNQINAITLQNMFLGGAKRIEANKEYINELNVFPVPDGDTGTNMSMTIMSAAKEVGALEEPTMDQLSKRSQADLFVAREVTPALFYLSCSVDLQERSRKKMY